MSEKQWPNRRSVLEQGVIDFGIETATLPNNLTIDLAIVRHPGASAIVALDGDGSIAMLSQYRYAIGGYLWEVPAGCRADGESFLDCAKRELREEAGLAAARWDRLGSIVTVPSFCDERIELFLARDLSRASGDLDSDEVIRVERLSIEKVLTMIRAGDIVDSKTIAALHHASDAIESGR
jgi:8-oxo-dGTP pyrophosphatase MutT (NUDIX family)